MPGRGQPWKGVGFGNPDRIGTGAIADGSITEADLDSNVTSKLNAGGHQIQDEGTPLTDRSELNFVGAGVVASDDGEKTVVTIAGGGGGGGSGFPDPNVEFTFYDEFIYNIFINENWEQISGSGTWDVTISAIGGVVGRNTSGETGSGGGLRVNQNSLIDVSKDFVVKWKTRSLSVSLLANRTGLFAENTNPAGTFPFGTEPTPYIWFAHDGTEVHTNWQARTHDGSTPNTTDTGVAVDTVFHVFEIERSGTTITFRIDGSDVGSFTTNLPTGNLQMAYFSQDGENVSKQQQFDTAQLQNTL